MLGGADDCARLILARFGTARRGRPEHSVSVLVPTVLSMTTDSHKSAAILEALASSPAEMSTSYKPPAPHATGGYRDAVDRSSGRSRIEWGPYSADPPRLRLAKTVLSFLVEAFFYNPRRSGTALELDDVSLTVLSHPTQFVVGRRFPTPTVALAWALIGSENQWAVHLEDRDGQSAEFLPAQLTRDQAQFIARLINAYAA